MENENTHYYEMLNNEYFFFINSSVFIGIIENASIYRRYEYLFTANKWRRLLKSTEVPNWLKIDTEYTDEDYVNSGEIYWPTRAYENPASKKKTLIL